MALFDAVINNTDRKIGHLLPRSDGKLFGCDHGVTFHHENKLRTVLWQWAGSELSLEEITVLEKLLVKLQSTEGDAFKDLLTIDELDALNGRIRDLISTSVFPLPSTDWPAIPWPAF
jgi:uncharacterized repeat protein (TIGR03843 family)